jgi:transposase
LLSEAKITIGEKWIKKALSYEFEHAELTYTFRLMLNRWLELFNKIKEINNELQKQAKKDPLEEIYRSAPGIGPQAARILSNELGDMAQFESEKKLFSYTGLTPSEYSSGQHIRQGRISKQGNTSVRRILILCSWVAIGKDKSLGEIYSRLAKRAGGKRAIVAIARRLIGRIRACLLTGSLYELQAV